ncbi:MAG: hypothetical protein HS104_11825 [Polyangiaceae bacterium]|nr:hypothetical protein [Polyangiaceae bacterium]MCE7893639.1 hypothetical protein [Sorangiineae bacterium PRO1]MCL4748532.1 hypothetical protein [Myxococcales bacterium]
MDADDLTGLALRVLDGDTPAWHALWRRVEPRIWALTGRWQITGPLCKSPDDRREIVLKVMAKLREGGFRRLRAFVTSAGGKSEAAFAAWLHTVATRVAVDYTRAHPEHVGRGEQARWVRLVPIDDVPPPIADRDLARHATVLRVLERARDDLSVQQLTALSLWLDGESNETIAERLGSATPAAAERALRAALKRLRDRYREPAVEAELSPEEPS